MYFNKILRLYKNSLLTNFVICAGFLLVFLTTSCTALTPQQTDNEALKVLRQMTSGGKLPPESAVLQIENTFAKSRTGALAKLILKTKTFKARRRFSIPTFFVRKQMLPITLCGCAEERSSKSEDTPMR
jgi:hypothetical protein